MGYESKVYIVNKTNVKGYQTEKNWAEVIATFDLSKMGNFVNIFEKETDCYFYADDGNTQVHEDNCGDKIKESSIETVIQYLENFESKREHYRRIAPLLGLLKSFTIGEWENLAVLHYGH